MLNTLSSTPKIIGELPLPSPVRHDDGFSKKVAFELPKIKAGYGLAIEFANHEDLRIGRKQILTATMRLYGSGRVQTVSQDNILYVWLKPEELEISQKVRLHILEQAENEVRNAGH